MSSPNPDAKPDGIPWRITIGLLLVKWRISAVLHSISASPMSAFETTNSDQRRASHTALCKRLGELWAIAAFATFDLNVLTQQRSGATVQVSRDGCPLGFNAEAAVGVLVGCRSR